MHKIPQYFKKLFSKDSISKGNLGELHLNELVADLSTLLTRNGFIYEAGQSYPDRQIANGFFVNEKVKIGIIYRRNNLGAVIYEVTGGNISHDELFTYLGKETEKALLFDKEKLYSYTQGSTSVKAALLKDLEYIVIPFINNTPVEEIKASIIDLYKKSWA